MRHIDKLMLSTSTLALESVPSNVNDRPRAVRFEAGVGDEIIDFEPAVFLEGKVKIACPVVATVIAVMIVGDFGAMLSEVWFAAQQGNIYLFKLFHWSSLPPTRFATWHGCVT